MSTEDDSTIVLEDLLFEDSYQNLPNWEYETLFYRALRRAEYNCEACGQRVDPATDARQWHIHGNDFSQRNTVILCGGCVDREDWREDVLRRRMNRTGAIRGRVMSALWGFSTTTIRYAEHLIVGGLIVLLFALSTSGVWPFVVGATATYLAHYTIWTYRDPRGYRRTNVAEWKLLTICTLVGLGYGVIYLLYPSAGTFGLYAIPAVGVGVTFGMTIRADYARYVANMNPLVVGVLRALVILSLTVGIVGLPFEVETAGLLTPEEAVILSPVAIALGYLVYRTPRDSGPRDWLVERYDRVVSRLSSWGWDR